MRLYLRHSSFPNPSFAWHTSQIILQPLRYFTYVIGTSHTSSVEPPLVPASFSNSHLASPTSQLILQTILSFTYVTGTSPTSCGEPPMFSLHHSPTLTSLRLRHSSFSNPSFASPTSQLILQPHHYFTYITGFSTTSSGEPPMVSLPHSPTLTSLHLRHSSFYNPSVTSPTSQALHLRHLASRPWERPIWHGNI